MSVGAGPMLRRWVTLVRGYLTPGVGLAQAHNNDGGPCSSDDIKDPTITNDQWHTADNYTPHSNGIDSIVIAVEQTNPAQTPAPIPPKNCESPPKVPTPKKI
jgi:hypothetical protein